MRKQVRILLAVLACVCVALSCMWIPQHRLSGNLTISQADLDARDRAFVLQNFAQAEDYEQLTHAVLQFAYTHFTYDLDSIPAYQNFSFGRFANNDFTVLCFAIVRFYWTRSLSGGFLFIPFVFCSLFLVVSECQKQ